MEYYRLILERNHLDNAEGWDDTDQIANAYQLAFNKLIRYCVDVETEDTETCYWLKLVGWCDDCESESESDCSTCRYKDVTGWRAKSRYEIPKTLINVMARVFEEGE